METLLQDIRYGIRMLAKSPAFTAVAVLTLALGIGANTAIFSVVNAVLLRPLPYKDPGQLVQVWGKFDKMGIPRNSISEPEWWELKDANQSFSDLAAYSGGDGDNLTTSDGRPVRVVAGETTFSLFPLLGVHPKLGRFFSADEDQPGPNHVALLSDALWKSQFGSDPNIVGKVIRLDAEAYTVVGVLPAGFEFAGKNEVWTPLGLNRAKPQDRGSHYLDVIARLKPSVTLAQASAEMDRFAAQLAREYPSYVPYGPDGGWGVYLVPLEMQLVGDVRPALLVLLGAVAFVLLIACANIANLLLARASSREREIAVRIALGAGKLRVVRQLFTEQLLLAFLGGGLGLLLAYWGVDAIRHLSPENLPRVGEIGLDRAVLGFTFSVSILASVIFGLAPALHVAGANLRDCLKEGGQGGSSGRGSRRLRDALVVSEIGLALVLLIGAGLMARSFVRLLEVSPGFQTQHILTMQLSLPEAKYKDGPPVTTFYRQLLDHVKALPGVVSAGAVSELPLGGAHSSGSVFIEDTPRTDLARLANYPFLEVDSRWTTPGYLEAMGIPLVRGRLLTDADDSDAPLVAIVDTDFARSLWPNQDPIGKHVAINFVPDSKPRTPMWRTVVGVVGHVKHYSLDVEGREQAYFPHAQVVFARTMNLAVRAAVDPTSLTSAIRQRVLSLDQDLPIYQIKTMDEWLTASVAQSRLNLLLLFVFAALALVLAGVGIYGVMAYTVVQRTHEIGIRMALGAHQKDVLGMVMRHGARLASAGVMIGLAAAFALTRLMSSLLFGVKATDPETFAGVALLLLAVALSACYVPARRATRVDPIIALRYE